MKKITIVCIAMMAYAAAQTPPAAPADTRKFKDAAEEALAIATKNEKDPNARLEKLDKWKNDYPTSDFADARTDFYFSTYGELKRYHDQIMAAQELRKKVPDNLVLLRTIFVDVQQIKPPSAEDLAAVADAAQYIIDHPDQVFDPSKKPADQTAQQWADLKPQMVAYAKTQLDFVAQTGGEAAMIARLKQDPTRVTLNGILGQMYLEQGKKDPSKLVPALFHYARVAMYDGPGAATPQAKAASKKFFDAQYKGYHGTSDGADAVLALAKANALPPDGFDIVSITKISEDKIKAEEAARANNPMLALWTDTKTSLVSGAADVEAIKGAEMPGTAVPGVTKFKGKIVSMTPALNPKKIVLAVEKDGVPDATLLLDVAEPGKMDVGGELEFEGVVKEISKDPYMLTFQVEKSKIGGWTGKRAPAGAGAAKKKPGI